MASDKREVILYADEFKKFHYWDTICKAAGVTSNCEKIILQVKSAESVEEEEVLDEIDEEEEEEL